MEFDRRHLAAHLCRNARVRQAPQQMPQNLQFRLCKFRAFCHADLNRRRRVREDMFTRHRLPDDIHQTLLRRVLIPQAVSPGPLCLVQNRAVDQRGHNNNFALRLYGFDLTNGSQAVLAVLRLHIHQNQIDGACPAHLNRLLCTGDGRRDPVSVFGVKIAFQQTADHGLVFNDHHSHVLLPPVPAD